jgi:hypothetical protein
VGRLKGNVEAALVHERRTGCGAEDGVRRLAVPLYPSRYNWRIGRTVDNEEVLEDADGAAPKPTSRRYRTPIQ